MAGRRAYIGASKKAYILAGVGELSNSNPYDLSDRVWTVPDIDNWIAANRLLTGKTIKFPELAGITPLDRSYYSTTAFNTLDANNDITFVGATLADTDAIVKWCADWSEDNSITQETIDMDNYDARTSASDADKARFSTAESENHFVNLTQ